MLGLPHSLTAVQDYIANMGPMTGPGMRARTSPDQTDADLIVTPPGAIKFGPGESLESIQARLDKLNRPNIDVAAMSPEQAQGRLDQLKFMRDNGMITRDVVDAMNGEQRTKSLDTLLDWLSQRAASAPQGPRVEPPPILDVKV